HLPALLAPDFRRYFTSRVIPGIQHHTTSTPGHRPPAWRSGLLLGIALLSSFNAAAQRTNAPDAFAAIGAAGEAASDELAMPQPPKLPRKILRWEAHDPTAVFQAAKKMETAEELAAALADARRETARFLEDHAPALVSTRRIQPLNRFDWRIATPDDWQNFPAALSG